MTPLNTDVADHRTQYVALFIMFGGLLIVAAADHFGLHNTGIAALGVIGTGQGILIGPKMASVLNQKGGTINAPITAEQPGE